MLPLILIATAALAAAQNGPTIQETGSARVLFQNDLSTNASTSALYLSKQVPWADASTSCQALSEDLLDTVTDVIKAQLAYLAFAGDLSNSSRLWLGQQNSGSNVPSRFRVRRQETNCSAYSLQVQGIVSAPCNSTLPALCSNTPAPFSANNTAAATGSKITIPLNDSSITGFRDARSFRFLGIPFAQPPIGNLRFQPAQPINTSLGNFTALEFAPSCVQGTDGSTPGINKTDEDCLYLNVWTPALPANDSASKLLPVALWVYGGSFTSGSGSVTLADGGNVASRSDVVAVSFNYRLGALGFLASPTSLDGNQGITDQIAALEWIKKNIAAFGGDPNRITIYGESAGGQSVIALLSSSRTKSLFSAALAQSAPIEIPWTNRATSTTMFQGIAQAVGCNNTAEADAVQCLRQVNSSAFVSSDFLNSATQIASTAYAQYSNASLITSAVEPFLPTVGTGVIDGQFKALLQAGSLPNAGIPFLVGNVENEGDGFVPAVLPQPINASTAVYDAIISQAFSKKTANAILQNPTLFAYNTSDPDAIRDGIGNLITLNTWQCPLQQIVATAQDKSTFSSLYTYRFDAAYPISASLAPTCLPDNPSGVDHTCHAEDVAVVFGAYNVLGIDLSGDNLAYIQYVADTWGSFFRTHDPNPDLAYLQSRGSAYQATAALHQQAAFDKYPSFHVFANPPNNTGAFFPQQCQVLADAGFLYDAPGVQQT